MQITKRIPANALDLVGVQQQQLQRVQSFEDATGQVFDLVAVQHSVDCGGGGRGVVVNIHVYQ